MYSLNKMISAQELRARQASRVEKDKDEFRSRFKKATDAYYETIMREVKSALEAVQDSSYTYIILNYKPLTADYEGLKYTTMLYGYWIKEKEDFDDSVFDEQGVEKPFERAKKELDALGYRLENVSDSSVSKKLFLRLSWGDVEERPRKPIQKRPRFTEDIRKNRDSRGNRDSRNSGYSRDARDSRARRYRNEDSASETESDH